jgi:hypothetical protein
MGTQLDFDGCPSPVRHRDDGADFGIDKPDPISFAPHADCKTLLIPSFFRHSDLDWPLSAKSRKLPAYHGAWFPRASHQPPLFLRISTGQST